MADRVSVSHITDDMNARVERVADEIYESWRVTANRDAYVVDAIRAAAREGASVGSAVSTGALVSPEQTTGHAGQSVSPVTDDMVQRGARAVVGTIFRDEFEASHNKHIDLARAVLSAALAGCTPVVLPEPDDTDEYGPRWDTERDMPIRVEMDGGPPAVWDCDQDMAPESAEQHGLALLAAAREARRLAGGSQVGDQHGDA